MHTKGPWKHRGPQPGTIGGHEVFADTGIVGSFTALVCQCNHHPDRQARAEADAKLIASAPDLLMACKILTAFVEDTFKNNEDALRVCNIGSDAIKKAIGGQYER